MNLIIQHIMKHLLHLGVRNEGFFQEVFDLIQYENKHKHAFLLKYIHLLIDELLSGTKQETKVLHLHFQYDIDDHSLNVIAQYLLIRFFYENTKSIETSSQRNERLESIKAELSKKLEKLYPCPEGARRMNGGNKIYTNWINEKNNTKTLLDFYNKFDSGLDVTSNAIFNCQSRLIDSLNGILATRPFACKVESYDIYPSFNLLNTDLTINELDDIENSFIDNLKTVIIFNCERNSTMQYFSLHDIMDYEIKLKKFLIFSFGNKKHSVKSLEDKLTLIQNRFKTPKTASYTILQSEIEKIFDYKGEKSIPVSFIGIERSDIWDTFVLETNILDLYELRSTKMMNLYSLCFNNEIKDFIINDIFSKNDTSELISDETKHKLLNLRDEDLTTLVELLEIVLDLIVRFNLEEQIIHKIKIDTTLVVDDFVLNSNKLRTFLRNALKLTPRNNYVSWSDLKTIDNGDYLILSYQDQGKYPYYFYPNVIETRVPNSTRIEAIYTNFLFSLRYNWAMYTVTKDLYITTDHPIRQKYFEWSSLKSAVNTLKPRNRDLIDWSIEQRYLGNSHRDTIKLKLKGDRERTFNSSELFIFSTDEKKTYRVDKISMILDALDENQTCFLHQLDEIQDNINLYEKMVDTSQQEEELNVIRQQFQITHSETGRLWKVLLKQKANESNEEDVYEELKKQLIDKGLKIVSLHHFKTNWLNPESESIAPISKEVFIELCDFLKLPKTYFFLIQRLRNSSKQSSRQSTQQMNRLLQDLFNDGCFNKGTDYNKIIRYNLERYKKIHPLDELGIDEQFLADNLISLVELINNEIKLKEFEVIMRSNDEQHA